MNKKTLFYFFALFIFQSCNQTDEPSTTDSKDNATEIKIDPNDKRMATSDKLIKEFEFIPLETTSQSLIGKIDKMLITSRYFLFLNKRINTIFFFEKDGKFSHKIDGATLKQPKLRIMDFDVVDDKIFINDIDAERKGLLTCKFDGTLLKPTAFNELILYFKVIGSQKYYYTAFLPTKDGQKELYSMHKYGADDKLIKEYFPFDKTTIDNNKVYLPEAVFFQSDRTHFFSRAYCNEFYKISEKDQLEKFKVILPEGLSIPKDFLTNSDYEGERTTGLKKYRWIWSIKDLFLIDKRYLSMKMQYANGATDICIYDLERRKLINLNNLAYSQNTNWLPIMEQEILASDGKYFYGNLSTKFMTDAHLKFEDKGQLYQNPVLKSYYEKVNSLSNPIITKFNIKSID